MASGATHNVYYKMIAEEVGRYSSLSAAGWFLGAEGSGYGRRKHGQEAVADR
jgi:hypothetical protein